MKKNSFRVMLYYSFLILFLLNLGADNIRKQPLQTGPPHSVKPEPGQSLTVDLDFGKIPLYFIPNRGQFAESILFSVSPQGYTLWLTEQGLTFDVRRFKNREVTHDVQQLVFFGAKKKTTVIPVEESSYRVNYLIGDDPSRWKRDIPTSTAVLIREVYEGIDLKLYGVSQQLEYDWIVSPGVDPALIRFSYPNALETEIEKNGDLLVQGAFGKLIHRRPLTYQVIDGKRKTVDSRFHECGDRVYGIEVVDYDKSCELVIDPRVSLDYSTFLGGSGNDSGRGIAVDSSGKAYLVGETYSNTDFPRQGAYQNTFGGGSWDAFVTKFSASGDSLEYSTYLGGNSEDSGLGIAVDGSGRAIVTGFTRSPVYPTSDNAVQDTHGGGIYDAFVTKLSISGSSLEYSTYLGGSGEDYGRGVDVDSSGKAYVTGETSSNSDFPLQNASQGTFGGGTWDGFVTRFSASGTSLEYSTYLGGNGYDYGYGVAVDSSGKAYVTGKSGSSDFPVANQYQQNHGGGVYDAFVTKLSASGTSLEYSTYLGGSGSDSGNGIAVDSSGSAYVTGNTLSNDFPTQNAFQSTRGGGTLEDGFVSKFHTNGASLVYSTYLGGGDYDYANGIAVDHANRAVVTGKTRSSDFPTKIAYQSSRNGTDADAFVTKFNPSGSGLICSTYLGGSGHDGAFAVAVDSIGHPYITGDTISPNFPTENPFQSTNSGTDTDAFATKIGYSRYHLIGSWTGQGVYSRCSYTDQWKWLASEASQIACGDLDGDGDDDLVGSWPAQNGIWARYSSTGQWAHLSTPADWIACGDMNGDGRDDLVGTWENQGVYYRNSVNGSWVHLSTYASLVTAGDLDNDGTDDLVGRWDGQGGMWTRYSSNGSWGYLATAADSVAVGDMNGDGRDDLVGSWTGQGVYYCDSSNGNWHLMASAATRVAAGDMDGDGQDDLLGDWAEQGGTWVQYSHDNQWRHLSTTSKWITTGKWYVPAPYGPVNVAKSRWAQPLIDSGPELGAEHLDFSMFGPGGARFRPIRSANMVPGSKIEQKKKK